MKTQSIFNSVLTDLNSHVDSKQNTSVFGLSFGEKAIFLCSQKKQIVFVTSSVADGIKLSEEMKCFGKTCKTIMPTNATYFSLGSNTFGENVVSSIDALSSLSKNSVDCLVVSPTVLMQKFAQKSVFSKSIIELKVGQTIKIDVLRQSLIKIGYKRVDNVSKPSEFSERGDVFTIFDILEKKPYKLEFFDDFIETISHVDLETYKKTDDVKRITISPTSTFIFNDEEKSIVLKKIQNDFDNEQKKLDVNEAIKLRTNFEEFKINFDADNFSYVQNWLLAYSSFSRFTDYLDDDAIIVFDDVKQIVDSIKTEYQNFYELFKQFEESGSILSGQKNFFVSSDEVFFFNHQLLSFQQIEFLPHNLLQVTNLVAQQIILAILIYFLKICDIILNLTTPF